MEKKYKLTMQIHHMTELLEAVDWDEDKLSELLVEIEDLFKDALVLDTDVTDHIERKFGLAAKKALESIVNTELCRINLSTKGDKSVN